jgi:hypothetical protein
MLHLVAKISVCFQGFSLFAGGSTRLECNMESDLTCGAALTFEGESCHASCVPTATADSIRQHKRLSAA